MASLHLLAEEEEEEEEEEEGEEEGAEEEEAEMVEKAWPPEPGGHVLCSMMG